MFASLHGYRIGWLPGDLIAGLMLAAIAISGQLATARLAGMPPETGLYAFAAGSLAFAAFGVNRFMSVAADSTIAPIFAGGIAAFAATDGRRHSPRNWFASRRVARDAAFNSCHNRLSGRYFNPHHRR